MTRQPIIPATPRDREAIISVLRYRKSKDINDLQPALRYLDPLINQRVGQFKGVEIPEYVMKQTARDLVVKGLAKYDPRKASLNTHAYNQLKGLRRFVVKHQNTARVPEHRALQIGEYKTAYANLKEQLERDPSPAEVADYLSWPTTRVEQIMTADRKSNIIQDDTGSFRPYYNPIEDKADVAYYSMAPQEQVIFDMLTGNHGYKKHSLNETARKMGMTYQQVYKVKQKIARQLKELM